MSVDDDGGFEIISARELIKRYPPDAPPTNRPISVPSAANPYFGNDINGDVVMWTGERVSLTRAKEIISNFGGNVGEIYKRFGDWCVTDTGVDCLSHPYWVEVDRLHEDDWVRHMAEKCWVNIADFSMALESARDRFSRGKPANKPMPAPRKPAGFRLSTDEKEAVKKHRQRKQLRRARRLIGTQQKLRRLSDQLETRTDE